MINLLKQTNRKYFLGWLIIIYLNIFTYIFKNEFLSKNKFPRSMYYYLEHKLTPLTLRYAQEQFSPSVSGRTILFFRPNL